MNDIHIVMLNNKGYLFVSCEFEVYNMLGQKTLVVLDLLKDEMYQFPLNQIKHITIKPL